MEVVTDLIPVWDLPMKSRMEFRHVTRQATLACAAKELNLDIDRFYTRTLDPGDLGLKSWENWGKAAGTSKDQQYIAIYKVVILDNPPFTGRLIFNVAGATRSILPLDELSAIIPTMEYLNTIKHVEYIHREYGIENLIMEGYLCSSIIIKRNEQYEMILEPRKEIDRYTVLLGGFVVEPRGMKINP